MNVAVIPARGGSKRIPGKNVRPFAGRPMISHSIRCALATGLFDEVIVSTDDTAIAEVAERYGATVPFRRPTELSDDMTGTTPAIAHAIEWLRRAGRPPAAVCCLYATAPLVQATDVAAGLALLRDDPVALRVLRDHLRLPGIPRLQGSRRRRTRDAVPGAYRHAVTGPPRDAHDAGQFYWGRPDAWLAHEPIFARDSTVVRIPRWRVQDIDTPEDWERAEVLHRMLASDQDAAAR